VPASGSAPDHAAPAAGGPQDQEAWKRELLEQLERAVRAVRDDLPTSRAMRQHAAREIERIDRELPCWRELREWCAPRLEKLIARGTRKDAAELAFRVAQLDSFIEALEGTRQTAAGMVAHGEAWEALWTGTAADSLQAGRVVAGDHASARAELGRDIDALKRAYGETGNPLYVWEALSLLCVPSILERPSDRTLPGWCVEYLARAAEALLGLSPPGAPPEGGIKDRASAVSKALALTRQGWDAYLRRKADGESASDAELYARVRELGIPDKDAKEAAVGFWRLEDERSVRRRLSRARRATPRGSKPAP
jgi:hypothetical protein